MKTLYLIRHAKSSWKNELQDDFDRPLNQRGKDDAPMMGQRLKKLGLQPDMIVSSPAKRARKTAAKIAAELNYQVEKILLVPEIYEAEINDLLGVTELLPDSAATVFLVGHNPGISGLAAYLTGNFADNLPTCSVYAIDFQIDSWQAVSQGLGTCRFWDYPKKQ